METLLYTERRISALNDLIRINNDRVTGYKRRLETILDDDLEEIFFGFICQGELNIYYLTKYIHELGGKPAGGNALSGKFYHSWTDFKLTVIKQDRSTMLDYCEYSEDVAKSVYSKVLNDEELLQSDKKLSHLLNRQYHEFKASHLLIKTLHDQAAAAA